MHFWGPAPKRNSFRSDGYESHRPHSSGRLLLLLARLLCSYTARKRSPTACTGRRPLAAERVCAAWATGGAPLLASYSHVESSGTFFPPRWDSSSLGFSLLSGYWWSSCTPAALGCLAPRRPTGVPFSALEPTHCTRRRGIRSLQ